MTFKLFVRQDSSQFRMAGASAKTVKHYEQLKLLEQPTTVVDCGIVGRGLIADNDIKKDDYIVEYVGELVNESEYLTRYNKYKKAGYRHDYFATIKAGMLLDATIVGNNARFANHSCDPNSEFMYTRLKGSRIYVLHIVATRNIRKGDQITLDYKWYHSETGEINLDECNCQAKSCRGYL